MSSPSALAELDQIHAEQQEIFAELWRCPDCGGTGRYALEPVAADGTQRAVVTWDYSPDCTFLTTTDATPKGQI